MPTTSLSSLDPAELSARYVVAWTSREAAAAVALQRLRARVTARRRGA
jgi:hypothetical protein